MVPVALKVRCPRATTSTPTRRCRPGPARCELVAARLPGAAGRGPGRVLRPAGSTPAPSSCCGPRPAAPGRGHLLDLGCGYGPIACTLAHRAPAAVVWAVDVNEPGPRPHRPQRRRPRPALGARRCARRPSRLSVRFAGIWSNPPIRVGKAALHELLADWLPRLEPDGGGLAGRAPASGRRLAGGLAAPARAGG